MPGCTFQKRWLSLDDYKIWIQESKSVNFATCKFCRKEIDLRGMGKSALKSHLRGKKHQDFAKADQSKVSGLSRFFKKNDSDSSSCTSSPLSCSTSPKKHLSESLSTASTPSPSTSGASVSTISDFVAKEDVLKSEIYWTLYTVVKHHSFNSNSGIGDMFKLMFPDSNIASKFGCSERKTAYLATFGIAPYFSSILEQKSKNDDFVLLFQESLNKSMQTKQMDFHIRFWDVNNQVKTRYLTSEFLGHARVVDMDKAMDNATKNLNLSKLIQISMDGPNVNTAFHRKFDDRLHKDYETNFLDVGSCGLHKVHGAFQAAVSASSWNVDGILKSMYRLFKHTPARRDDYISVTNSSLFPL